MHETVAISRTFDYVIVVPERYFVEWFFTNRGFWCFIIIIWFVKCWWYGQCFNKTLMVKTVLVDKRGPRKKRLIQSCSWAYGVTKPNVLILVGWVLDVEWRFLVNRLRAIALHNVIQCYHSLLLHCGPCGFDRSFLPIRTILHIYVYIYIILKPRMQYHAAFVLVPHK